MTKREKDIDDINPVFVVDYGYKDNGKTVDIVCIR